MTPDERIYALIAAGEDAQAHAKMMQSHAETLQSRVRAELDALPGIVREAGREVRAQATRWIVIGAAVIVALGVVAGAGVSAYIRHDVGNLRAEADALRAEITEMEQTAAELAGKTWRLELATWQGERGIILPRGVTVERTAPLTDKSGRIAVILKP